MLYEKPSAAEFSDASIEQVPHAKDLQHRVQFRDPVTPGLMLRVGTRTKSFYFIRTLDGTLHKKRIGRFPAMTLERARAAVQAYVRNEERLRTREVTRPVTVVDKYPGVELLTTAEAAELVKLSEAWFARMRWEGVGPPYYQRRRAIRYVKSELLDWFLSRPKPGGGPAPLRASLAADGRTTSVSTPEPRNRWPG